MKGRILNIALVLVLATLPMAANAGWSEAQQVTDQALPAPAMVEETTAPDVDFNSSPVMFIENVGQWDDGACFQVWGGPAGTMWLAEDAIWITMLEPVESRADDPRSAAADPVGRLSPDRRENLTPRSGVNIRLSFVGANPHPRIETFDRLDTTVSYFYGNDPEQWRPDVPVWGGVRYVDLYPGIDLELTNEDGWVVQRLVALPGADLVNVQLRVEGADAVAVDGDRLRLSTAAGELAIPLLQVAGATGVATVQMRDGRLFDVISPFASPSPTPRAPRATLDFSADNSADLLYSTFLGGVGWDEGRGIAVDGAGSTYLTGRTGSGNFPTTPGAFDTSQNYLSDAFVAKLNPAGSGLAYATFLGSGGSDAGRAIAVDESGSAYVTGETSSGTFPTTAGAFDRSFNGGEYDSFVAKLNPAGSGLAYATFLGGSSWDDGWAITVDGTGSAYVLGHTWSSNFPTTSGAFDTSQNGYDDAFVVKLNSAGSELAYATFLGGSSRDTGWAIAVDGAESAYVTGYAVSEDFPTTPGAFDRSHNGGYDAFVVKLNPAGSGLAYATYLGGRGLEWGMAIAVDGAGSTYLTGRTGSGNFPTTPGAFDPSHNGGDDAFVVKLNPVGSGLAYSTFLGGGDHDEGGAITVDGTGSAYMAGRAASSNFPTTPGAFDESHNGHWDVFVAKLNPTGNDLVYGTFLGGSDGDGGYAITVDVANSVYVTGYTGSNGFPTTLGTFDTSFNGGPDAFVAKLAMGGTVTYSVSGRLTDGNGVGVPGIVVRANASNSALTDVNGAYVISGLVPGTYTIAPSKVGYMFCPRTLRVVISSFDKSGQDFVTYGDTASIGFCPNPNGYWFSNSSSLWGTYPWTANDFRVEDMIRMFGREAVCVSLFPTTCWPKEEALSWLIAANIGMNGGHCDGFSTTSLRFFRDIGNPSPGDLQPGALTAYDLDFENARRNIAYYQALAGAPSIEALRHERLQRTPQQVLDELRAAMATGTNVSTTLVIYKSPALRAGHAVVPFAIESRGNNVHWIWVYDNNHPRDTARHVEVNAASNTWNYHLGGNEYWSGSGAGTLAAMPISAYNPPHTCPWCESNPGEASLDYATIMLMGAGHLLITDSQGRRIGYVGTQFIHEIPDAFAAGYLGGLGIDSEPTYYVPSDELLQITLDGQTLTQPQTTGITLFGPGVSFEATTMPLRLSSRDQMVVRTDTRELTYLASATSKLALAIATSFTNESYRFEIQDADVLSGETVEIEAESTSGQLRLSYQGVGTDRYDLVFQRMTGAGPQSYFHHAVEIVAGDTHYADYRAWDGRGSMTLLIDRGSNGTIDETTMLQNQVRSVYLPAISNNQ